MNTFQGSLNDDEFSLQSPRPFQRLNKSFDGSESFNYQSNENLASQSPFFEESLQFEVIRPTLINQRTIKQLFCCTYSTQDHSDLEQEKFKPQRINKKIRKTKKSQKESQHQCYCYSMCPSIHEPEITQPMKISSPRKNFPKLLGTHLIGYISQFENNQLPEGIRLFKVKFEEIKEQNKSQLSFGIQDFKNICLHSQESQEYFKDFLLNIFIVRLIHCSKLKNLDQTLQYINNAYAGACNPEQWKGNNQLVQ